jgi:hypothetical protein
MLTAISPTSLISIYEHRCILFDFYVVNAACSRWVRFTWKNRDGSVCGDERKIESI